MAGPDAKRYYALFEGPPAVASRQFGVETPPTHPSSLEGWEDINPNEPETWTKQVMVNSVEKSVRISVVKR
jgi:hypothetical protein